MISGVVSSRVLFYVPLLPFKLNPLYCYHQGTCWVPGMMCVCCDCVLWPVCYSFVALVCQEKNVKPTPTPAFFTSMTKCLWGLIAVAGRSSTTSYDTFRWRLMHCSSNTPIEVVFSVSVSTANPFSFESPALSFVLCHCIVDMVTSHLFCCRPGRQHGVVCLTLENSILMCVLCRRVRGVAGYNASQQSFWRRHY